MSSLFCEAAKSMVGRLAGLDSASRYTGQVRSLLYGTAGCHGPLKSLVWTGNYQFP